MDLSEAGIYRLNVQAINMMAREMKIVHIVILWLAAGVSADVDDSRAVGAPFYV